MCQCLLRSSVARPSSLKARVLAKPWHTPLPWTARDHSPLATGHSPLATRHYSYTPLGLVPSTPPVITVERTSTSTLVAAVDTRLATRPIAYLLALTEATC